MTPFTEEELLMLTPWLTEKASKVSDAEPEVLAEYIIALLNNNVEGDERIKLLSSSLEDFIDTPEKSRQLAVEIVEALKTKSYAAKGANAEELKKKAQKEALKITQDYFKKDVTSYNQAPPDYMSMMRRGPPQPHAPRPSVEELRAERDKQNEHLAEVASVKQRGKTVILSSVPLDKLDEAKIRAYFTRFGEITAVKLSTEYRTAEIEFAENKGARKAWSNPTPIFDNRFIKIFFKKPPPEEPKKLDIEQFKTLQLERQKEFEEKQKKKQERDKKLKQVIALKEKMLNDYETELSTLQEDLTAHPEKEQAIRERVEAIQKEMEENMVTPFAIAQDKAKLEGKVPTFVPRGRGALRGRGTIRGRGRGAAFAPYARRPSAPAPKRSLDLRTKTITVTNFSNAEDEGLKRALEALGKDAVAEVTSRDDNGVDITFNARHLAEQFMTEKTELDGMAPLKKIWNETARPPPPTTSQSSSASTTAPTSVGTDGAGDVEMK